MIACSADRGEGRRGGGDLAACSEPRAALYLTYEETGVLLDLLVSFVAAPAAALSDGEAEAADAVLHRVAEAYRTLGRSNLLGSYRGEAAGASPERHAISSR